MNEPPRTIQLPVKRTRRHRRRIGSKFLTMLKPRDFTRTSRFLETMKREESNTQINCVTWFRLQYPQYGKVLFSVPNGGMRPRKTKTLRDGRVISYSPEGKKLKEEGQTEGVSDLILLVPRHGYGALCVEMKRRNGKQSPEQKEWQEAAEAAGNKYIIIRSIEQFIKEVTCYISNN